jgi:hypothetical protein
MKHVFSLLAVMLLAVSASSQTYYYINSIAVAPSAPDTDDNIVITLQGDLSSTNAYIAESSFSMNGNTVQISVIAAAQGIGLPMLVPHDISFTIGTLPAGEYSIDVTGVSINDGAPAPQHEFVVSQAIPTPCDSLIIDFVQWQAFSDTAIEVHVFNTSQTLFDYPGFVLLQGTDSIARETVTYFGIAGESFHTLTLVDGATIPTGPFQAQLHLWTNDHQEQVCTYDLTVDLCPPAPCAPLLVYLNNDGNALINDTLDWQLLDDNNALVANGTFALGDAIQSDYDTVCVPPGDYTLSVTNDTFTGGQPYFGITAPGQFYSADQQPYSFDNLPDIVPVVFFGPCIDPNNEVPDVRTVNALKAWPAGDVLMINAVSTTPIGAFALLDAMGRELRLGRIMSNSGSVSLSGFAPGAYLLRTAVGTTRFVFAPGH